MRSTRAVSACLCWVMSFKKMALAALAVLRNGRRRHQTTGAAAERGFESEPPRRSGQCGRRSQTNGLHAAERVRAFAADGIPQSGLPFKGRIDFEKAVVHRPLPVIENHLNHAKALVQRTEQLAIPRSLAGSASAALGSAPDIASLQNLEGGVGFAPQRWPVGYGLDSASHRESYRENAPPAIIPWFDGPGVANALS